MDLSIFGDIIACCGLFYIFFEMFEWRVSRKKVLCMFIILLTFSGILYAVSIARFPGQSVSVFSIIFFTIPGLLLTLVFSKYRDSRLLFTYCAVDVVGFVLSMLLKIGVALYSLSEISMILISFASYSLLGFYAKKYQKHYWNVLRKVKGSWRLLAALSTFAYFMLYYQTMFPEPLFKRPEYIPYILLFSLFIIIVFLVIIFSLITLVKNHDYLIQVKEIEIYKKLSYSDPLTGLLNRRAFEDSFSEIISKRQSFGYGIIDLNGLKLINDNKGHSEGDKYIQKLANYLMSLNLHEVAYRIGGDEFAILIKIDCEDECTDFFEKINQDLEIKIEQIDASMGYGYFDDYSSEDVKLFLNVIDNLMYEKKKKLKYSA